MLGCNEGNAGWYGEVSSIIVVLFRPRVEGRVVCRSFFAVVGRCRRVPFNTYVTVGHFFLEHIIIPLQPFFLGIHMSDGRRNSSFILHIVGRETAGHKIYGHYRHYIATCSYLLSQHKTAQHVQHPTRNLHTRACARRTSIYTYSSSRRSHAFRDSFIVFTRFCE